jgi:antitoxin component YwqK of YwqJK toxin-antitoxin module
MGQKVILSCIFLLTTFQMLNAQQQANIIFFNEYLEASDSSKAKFRGILLKENEKWKFTLFNIENNLRLMSGYYIDSAMRINDGLYELWYDDSTKKREEMYDKGVPIGAWKLWDEHGKVIDSTVFANGEALYKTNYSYYLNDSLNMHFFKDMKAKKSIIKYYYKNGGIHSEIEYLNEKEVEKKDYYENGVLKIHSKNTEKGKPVFVKRFSETGVEISEKEYKQMEKERSEQLKEYLMQRTPEFNGGGIGFQLYLNKNLKIPDRVIRENLYVDEIVIKFSLDENGRAYNIIIDGVNDSELKDVVLKFFERAPSWNMKGLKTHGPMTYKIKLIH